MEEHNFYFPLDFQFPKIIIFHTIEQTLRKIEKKNNFVAC
jgi:hypothetical protein